MQEHTGGLGMGTSSSLGTPARLAWAFPSQHKALEPSPVFFLLYLIPDHAQGCSYCPPLNNILPVPLEQDFPLHCCLQPPSLSPLPKPALGCWQWERCWLPRPLADKVSPSSSIGGFGTMSARRCFTWCRWCWATW